MVLPQLSYFLFSFIFPSDVLLRYILLEFFSWTLKANTHKKTKFIQIWITIMQPWIRLHMCLYIRQQVIFISFYDINFNRSLSRFFLLLKSTIPKFFFAVVRTSYVCFEEIYVLNWKLDWNNFWKCICVCCYIFSTNLNQNWWDVNESMSASFTCHLRNTSADIHSHIYKKRKPF